MPAARLQTRASGAARFFSGSQPNLETMACPRLLFEERCGYSGRVRAATKSALEGANPHAKSPAADASSSAQRRLVRRPPRPRAPTRRLPSELKSHFGPIARRHHACICEDEQTRSCASVLRINCVSNYSSKSAVPEPPVELWRHPVGGSCLKSRRARAPHDCPATAQCTLLERRAASPPLRHILN